MQEADKQKILVIQTAFIGDVVLATALLEDLHHRYPTAMIDILVRKGNESLFMDHPYLGEVLVWNKKQNKYGHLFRLIRSIRQKKYDQVINLQRFAATGLITSLSAARLTVGFDKNPFSLFFGKKVKHIFSKGDIQLHEVERNFQLIEDAAEKAVPAARPKLYPSETDRKAIEKYLGKPFICIAPASVWFTKQFPAVKWIELIRALPDVYQIYLLGAPGDAALCDQIAEGAENPTLQNLAGKLNFLQSAALMKEASMNYVNDSAPMHFASAVNAPVTAVYCSTIPAFGYGPLSDKSYIVESPEPLSCRPCGIHGKKSCPENHFNCAMNIRKEQLLATLS